MVSPFLFWKSQVKPSLSRNTYIYNIYILCSIDITWLDHCAIKRKKTCEFTPLLETPILAAFNYSPLLPRDPRMFPCLMYFHMDWNSSCKLPPYYPEVLFIPVQDLPNGICSLVASIHIFVLIQPKNGSLKKIPGGEKIQLNSTRPQTRFFLVPPSRKTENGNQTDLQPCEEQRLTNFQVIGRLDMVGVDGFGTKNPRDCLFNGKRRLGWTWKEWDVF